MQMPLQAGAAAMLPGCCVQVVMRMRGCSVYY